MYDFQCKSCERVIEDVYQTRGSVDIGETPRCPNCESETVRLLPLPAQPQFARGVYAGTSYEWNQKQRAQLEKRSAEHDKSTAGKEQRYAAVERQVKAGNLPPAALKTVKL